MTSKQKAQLKDMQAYLQFILDRDMSFTAALGNLGHDIGGLIRKEECFLPRTDGYHKMMEGAKANVA